MRDASAPALDIRDLHVYFGGSHALQGIFLTLETGVLSVVGRNGMGKTTLCNAIVGLKPATRGSIRVFGREICGLTPHEIHRLGVAYVPQGRRCWPSLTVDEHLRLVENRSRQVRWTVQRIYQTFPQLAERRGHGGAQLSGGEQQMLAICRALLSDPALLVMDETTEGLAPVIVAQVEELLQTLARTGETTILLIEQNIGVATSVSDRVAIMLNGRINRVIDAKALAADRDLQHRLLGVGRHSELSGEAGPEEAVAPEQIADRARTKMTAGAHARARDSGPNPSAPVVSPMPSKLPESEARKLFDMPFSERIGKTVLVAGTFDTKAQELGYLVDRLKALGMSVRTVDLSTSPKAVWADVPAYQVAAMHPHGASAVMTGDRGASVTAMAEAFARWIVRERGIGGVISAGGSGGTSLATAAMRVLPVGVPKIMVSTVAAGDVSRYVGAADIMMFHSVADVQGLNSITEQVLSNAAHAMAGMVAQLPTSEQSEAKRRTARPAVGITMFGVTTPCVQAVTKGLEADYDCLVFHATGTGGRAMEKLGDSRLLAGFIDLTTTEVADMMVGGVMACDEDRFGAAIRTGLPYVGSVGALDMVNFGPRETVPDKFNERNFVIHNPMVTLMRTTRDENRQFGEWIGERLNAMNGPVCFLLPVGGVSALDAPGKAFCDPDSDEALFSAIVRTVKTSPSRRVERVNGNINDSVFSNRVIEVFRSIMPRRNRRI
jgi:uncharacterized protein (UPF0261 family)/ABC-type branched-subunit amino acid transport system ATPase component